MKKTFYLLIMIFGLAGCSSDSDEERTVTKIEFNKPEINIKIGEQSTLIIIHSPSDLLAPEYFFESNNKEVATVNDKGIVSAISVGKVVLTAISSKDPSLKTSCNVIVGHIEPTKISLNKKTLNIPIGSTEQLTYIIEPQNTTLKELKWTSTNTDVAIVDNNGNITAKSLGETDIKLEVLNSDLYDICKISVVPISVTGITVSVTGLDLNEPLIRTNVLVGNELIITPTIYPQNATNKEVTYTSSNTNVAEVKLIDGNYRIVTKEKGFSEIKVITVDGNHTATCEVTILDIDAFATINLSSQFVFDAFGQHHYLKVSFNTNVTNFVKINSLKVFDNNGNEPFNFTGFPIYKQSYIIEYLPISITNISDWKGEINVTWNGQDYNISSVKQ